MDHGEHERPQQLPAVYRRGMCFPLDDATEDQFRAWVTLPSAKVRHLPMDDDSSFYGLWRYGVVQTVNRECGLDLDEFEETVIESDVAENVIRVIQGCIRGVPLGTTRKLCDDMVCILEEARQAARPVFCIW